MGNIIYWRVLVEVVREILDEKYFVRICKSRLAVLMLTLCSGIVEFILKG